LNFSDIEAERKYGKFHIINRSKVKIRVESTKDHVAQSERAKGAKGQRFDCQTPELSGEPGRFGLSLDARGGILFERKYGQTIGTEVMNGCPRGLCTSYRAKSMKG
jgi:hypothetical protein